MDAATEGTFLKFNSTVPNSHAMHVGGSSSAGSSASHRRNDGTLARVQHKTIKLLGVTLFVCLFRTHHFLWRDSRDQFALDQREHRDGPMVVSWETIQ